MKIKNSLILLYLLMALATASGCATPISKNLRGLAEPNLTFEQVKQNPGEYESAIVVWGGEIINTANIETGTRIEILQKPLNYDLMPKYGDESGGRFIAIYDGFLDPAIYEKGRKITLAGEVVGQTTAPVGDIEYKYPLVAAEEVYLWRERRNDLYYYYPYPSPFYHHWRYGPYWYYH